MAKLQNLIELNVTRGVRDEWKKKRIKRHLNDLKWLCFESANLTATISNFIRFLSNSWNSFRNHFVCCCRRQTGMNYEMHNKTIESIPFYQINLNTYPCTTKQQQKKQQQQQKDADIYSELDEEKNESRRRKNSRRVQKEKSNWRKRLSYASTKNSLSKTINLTINISHKMYFKYLLRTHFKHKTLSLNNILWKASTRIVHTRSHTLNGLVAFQVKIDRETKRTHTHTTSR